MKKYNLFSILLILPFILTSCDKWLDVTPEDEIAETDLFTTGEGYRNALNGVYKSLSDADLYGKQLTWGLLDVMAQCYDVSNLATSQSNGKLYQYQATSYDYVQDEFVTVLETIWSKAYNDVANCNNIIQNIQKADPEIFVSKERERKLIEGEAYALRAFIQFDLLRMFAPAPLKNDQGKYIPYVTTYPSLRSPRLTVDSCMAHVISDLKQAKSLLWEFDSVNSSNFSVQMRLEQWGFGGDRFLISRGNRFNYYAVSGILARACMYAGKLEDAYDAALEVIKFQDKKGYYAYTRSSTYTNNSFENGNLKAYNDLLIAFYSTKLTDLDKEMNDYLGSNKVYYMKLQNIPEIFGTDIDDFRLKFQIETKNNIYRPLKYRTPSLSQVGGNISSVLIPIMGMSEIYYIAGEAICEKPEKLDEAKSYLMKVKTGRNLRNTDLSGVTTGTQFKDLLLLDARRELWGEGQLFFWYKRWDKAISNASFTKDKFVIPVPDSEIKI